ncbi:unnamed protein product [Ilex paraguariensis]|uniref:Uncharacterized protein n=1 Tax=Ilex paraguariensis TaxID=185542 RepID=A0ABC8TXK4_9AQUA
MVASSFSHDKSAMAANFVAIVENIESGADNITAVNGDKTLDLVPIENLPKPLTITVLSPALMHGAQLRVANQGVPGAYSEAIAGKAYPKCEAIPCDKLHFKQWSSESLTTQFSL